MLDLISDLKQKKKKILRFQYILFNIQQKLSLLMISKTKSYKKQQYRYYIKDKDTETILLSRAKYSFNTYI